MDKKFILAKDDYNLEQVRRYYLKQTLKSLKFLATKNYSEDFIVFWTEYIKDRLRRRHK